MNDQGVEAVRPTIGAQRRARAVAAAVAAGGLASLAVVLLGPPVSATADPAPAVVAQPVAADAAAARRADVTLGEAL